MSAERIAFVASPSESAQEALRRLESRYPHKPVEDADILVVLGGDGFMLQVLHENLDRAISIYGMNRGSVGFLMNDYAEERLLERVERAKPADLHPLRMRAHTSGGGTTVLPAINEVSLLRQTHQAAKLRISVDGKVRIDEMVCDGVLVATPAGSTAYNLSAHGPILPFDANALALTPISAFRPRRWRGAILPRNAHVRVDVLEPHSRPVSAVADSAEVRDVLAVDVDEDREASLRLLFDADHSLEERILNEQFTP